jgi:hypothetical protein
MRSWPAELAGVALKLDRANRHLDELSTSANRYLRDPSAYAVHEHFDRNTAIYTLEAELKTAPPDDLGVILGDFAHNARSALDHLVWTLVEFRELQQPGIHTQFPITNHPNDFDKQVADRVDACGELVRGWLEGLTAEDVQEIRAVQPFEPLTDAFSYHMWTQWHGPIKHPLTALQRLNNFDKHRVVHATAIHIRHDRAPSGKH